MGAEIEVEKLRVEMNLALNVVNQKIAELRNVAGSIKNAHQAISETLKTTELLAKASAALSGHVNEIADILARTRRDIGHLIQLLQKKGILDSNICTAEFFHKDCKVCTSITCSNPRKGNKVN